MKSKWLLALLIVNALFLASCASEPASAEDGARAQSLSAADAKKAADEARAKADEVKAFKAAADEYESALELYEQAATAETSGDGTAAIALYDQSTVEFTKAQSLAEEAREAALAAMAEVDKAISETEQKAEEALNTTGEEQ
ncbi:MAG: hypothetical protein PQJ59_05675 [Spirochaetales bacterium]|nr:hypothetical protein [Spirochaetales bacterium]